MLQHLDADEGIKGVLEFRGDISIVHKVDTHTPFKACSFDPLLSKSFLLNRQREAVDLTSEVARSLLMNN